MASSSACLEMEGHRMLMSRQLIIALQSSVIDLVRMCAYRNCKQKRLVIVVVILSVQVIHLGHTHQKATSLDNWNSLLGIHEAG
jgi:hypothetical protein